MAAKSNTDPAKAGIRVAIGNSKENTLFRTRPRGAFYPRQTKAAKKESCVICFENIDSELIMFPADECGHSFCSTCVKKYIEVKLLAGRIPNCLDLRCTSMLSINRCRNLLTPKLNCMWRQRIIEDSTPSADRVYCPYQTCSYLMSKFTLSLSASSESGFRKCFKCGGSFCVHCMVPWHSSLSCTDYKKLHPNPLNEDTELMSLANLEGWRQCGRCKHMVELSWGCNQITCRCGYAFCYTCGAGWYSRSHGGCTTFRSGNVRPAFTIVLVSLICLIVILTVY